MIDNQEAYNASGNWSVYGNLSDLKESHSDTEMKEGNFKLHLVYTKFQFIKSIKQSMNFGNFQFNSSKILNNF